MSNVKYDFPITHITCPVESITGVWEFKRPPFFKYLCYSLPGHLLHLVTKGSYVVKISGRKYQIEAGDVIYYYESEEVETIGNSDEVTFYSVGFQAPKLLPLPLEMRVLSSDKSLQELFHKLYEGFSANSIQSRSFKTFSTLLAILNNIDGLYSDSRNEIPEKKNYGWNWKDEFVKIKYTEQPSKNSAKLPDSVNQLSFDRVKKVTGGTPMQRIQKLRMEEAKGLLSIAQLNVTQVAEYLGYPRIHEFSREFSAYFGKPPSTLLGQQ